MIDPSGTCTTITNAHQYALTNTIHPHNCPRWQQEHKQLCAMSPQCFTPPPTDVQSTSLQLQFLNTPYANTSKDYHDNLLLCIHHQHLSLRREIRPMLMMNTYTTDGITTPQTLVLSPVQQCRNWNPELIIQATILTNNNLVAPLPRMIYLLPIPLTLLVPLIQVILKEKQQPPIC